MGELIRRSRRHAVPASTTGRTISSEAHDRETERRTTRRHRGRRELNKLLGSTIDVSAQDDPGIATGETSFGLWTNEGNPSADAAFDPYAGVIDQFDGQTLTVTVTFETRAPASSKRRRHRVYTSDRNLQSPSSTCSAGRQTHSSVTVTFEDGRPLHPGHRAAPTNFAGRNARPPRPRLSTRHDATRSPPRQRKSFVARRGQPTIETTYGIVVKAGKRPSSPSPGYSTSALSERPRRQDEVLPASTIERQDDTWRATVEENGARVDATLPENALTPSDGEVAFDFGYESTGSSHPDSESSQQPTARSSPSISLSDTLPGGKALDDCLFVVGWLGNARYMDKCSREGGATATTTTARLRATTTVTRPRR